MCNSKLVSVLFLVFYAVLLYFSFNTDMNAQMIAMRMMGIGMFLEAAVGVYSAFKKHDHKK
ncbi:hypothetical protein MOO44_04780 [Nicoliella spurrieriana]|uniref:Uncharacterized protein n=1 Tax=Nicoliella spurrieriana TaxID=2925830 RepID=A0A976RR31_9LACO|nr:hypothetical protein [Nicoliella spurrieriana]UQS86243.1 hypothetical protein MOO44_04780 [Nicoliella spurrieriana]